MASLSNFEKETLSNQNSNLIEDSSQKNNLKDIPNKITIFERELLNRVKIESLLTNKKFKSLKIPLDKRNKNNSQKRIELFSFQSFCNYFLLHQPIDEMNNFFDNCLTHISFEITIFEYITHILQKHSIDFEMFNYIESQILKYAHGPFIDEKKNEITNFTIESTNYLEKKELIIKEIEKRNQKKLQETLMLIKSGRIHF